MTRRSTISALTSLPCLAAFRGSGVRQMGESLEDDLKRVKHV